MFASMNRLLYSVLPRPAAIGLYVFQYFIPRFYLFFLMAKSTALISGS